MEMSQSQWHSQISEGTNLGFEPLPIENCRMHHIISIIFISRFFFLLLLLLTLKKHHWSENFIWFISFKWEHRLFSTVLSSEVPAYTAQTRAFRCYWKHSYLAKWSSVQAYWESSQSCKNNCTEANRSSRCAIKWERNRPTWACTN